MSGGRLSYESITAEIQAFIDRGPRGTQQRLAEAVFPKLPPRQAASAFRHRLDEYRGERLSYEEIELIQQEVGRILSRPSGAPKGWPFIPWKDAEAAEAVLNALKGSRS